MRKDFDNYILEIGIALSQLGNEIQKQVHSNQPLNIHGQVKKTMDYITFCLHNINADFDACRYDLFKDDECNLNLLEIESLKEALYHLLNGESYTHNGESSSPTSELYKMKFLIDSLYRLTTKGVQGSTEYIFDKITDKDI